VTRFVAGAISRMSSRFFAPSSDVVPEMPVMLPPGPREACDEAGADRIAGRGHYDRDFVCSLLRCLHRRRLHADDDIDLHAHQFGGELRKARGASFGVARQEPHGLSVNIAQLAQGLAQQGHRRLGVAEGQHADRGEFRRLGARGNRESHRTAEQ
jgi:hypothetical protein